MADSGNPFTLVFDLLAETGEDLRGRPYRTRRRLEQLLAAVRPPLALMPMTRDLAGAQTWMSEHADAGIEGVVFKDLGHGYRPGSRSWSKVRTRSTAEAVVGGVLGSLDGPEALVADPGPGGRLRVAGRTGPLPPEARREFGAMLAPPAGAHPWPPRISSSRFGQLPPEPIDYTPAKPRIVVEVDADVCFEQDRWRHPTTYLRLRLDLQVCNIAPESTTCSQTAGGPR